MSAAQELGVIDYIVKPTNPAQLIEILREKKDSWLSENRAPAHRAR
jgi:YesN/AraC family two-component response regulator